MEALGVAASLGQLIEFTLKTIKYLNSVKDASTDRTRLLREVPSLLSLLVSLKTNIDEKQSDTWFDGIRLLAVEDGPLDQLRDTLKKLIDKLKPKKGLQGVARKMIWALDKDYCEDLLRQIDRAKSTIGLALHGDTLKLAQAIKADTAAICGIDRRVATISQRLENLHSQENSKKRQEVLEWFSPLNFLQIQQDLFKRREHGTGQWLIDSATFQAWLSGPHRTLCCTGIPGAGKSILASVIVDFLARVQTKATSIGVAAIYCQFKDREMQTPENLFAGACVQLDFNTVYLVIDALDESSETNQRILLKQAEALSGNIRLLVTTRHADNIINRFRNCPKIEIRATDMDLKIYVSSRIAIENRLECMVRDDPSLENQLCERITTKADGMFLAAKLHMDALSSKFTPKSLRKALENLPTTLDELYNEALHRIEAQSPDDQQLAFNALRWVAYTYRPLGFRALQEALAIEAGEEDFDSDGLPPISLVIDVCAGLLTADAETREVRLVHYTTQDYMDSVLASKFPDAHALIAEDCISYLDYQVFQSARPDEQIPPAFGLFAYASTFWASHTIARRTPRLSTRVTRFLASSPSVHLMTITDYDRYRRNLSLRRLTRCDGYGIAAFLGLCDELNASLPHIDNVDKLLNGRRYCWYTGYRSPALHLAVYNHQVETVCILLDHGADIEKKDSSGNTPLHSAIGCKALETVKTLVQRGADIMAEDSNLQIPFQRVWWNSPVSSLQDLLDAGTILERRHLFEDSCLMRSIIEYGDHQTNQWLFHTALKDPDRTLLPSKILRFAAENRAMYMVNALFDFGVDVNSKDQSGNTALHGACLSDEPAVVERVLKLGTHVNERNNKGEIALHHAAVSQHEEFTKLLISCNSYIDVQNCDGFTPLMNAIKRRCTTNALHLLQQGASTGLTDINGMTALHLASAIGNTRIVSKLMEHGLSVDQESFFNLALFFADKRPVSEPYIFGTGFLQLIGTHSAIFAVHGPEALRKLEPILFVLASWQEQCLEWRLWEQGMTALDIALLRDDKQTIELLASCDGLKGQPQSLDREKYLRDGLGLPTTQALMSELDRRGFEASGMMKREQQARERWELLGDLTL